MKVALSGMLAHELNESLGERINVLAVEIRSGLVECEQTALHTENFGKRQADEQRREHLLARTAPGSHIHLLVALHHHLRAMQLIVMSYEPMTMILVWFVTKYYKTQQYKTYRVFSEIIIK